MTLHSVDMASRKGVTLGEMGLQLNPLPADGCRLSAHSSSNNWGTRRSPWAECLYIHDKVSWPKSRSYWKNLDSNQSCLSPKPVFLTALLKSLVSLSSAGPVGWKPLPPASPSLPLAVSLLFHCPPLIVGQDYRKITVTYSWDHSIELHTFNSRALGVYIMCI